MVSKLFGAAQDSNTQTEIVLLITPRIVRNLDVPGVGMQEFLSGTESAVGASPIQLGTPSVPNPQGTVPARSLPQATPSPAPMAAPAPPAFTPPSLIPSAPGVK